MRRHALRQQRVIVNALRNRRQNKGEK